MDDQVTTVKTSASKILTDKRKAYNDLAKMIVQYADKAHSKEGWLAIEKQREKIDRLEKEYRDATRLLYEALCARQKKG